MGDQSSHSEVLCIACGFTFPLIWIVKITDAQSSGLGRLPTAAIPIQLHTAIISMMFQDLMCLGARIGFVVACATQEGMTLTIVMLLRATVCVAVKFSQIVRKCSCLVAHRAQHHISEGLCHSPRASHHLRIH